MALALRSLLRGPKLRSGVKALVLASSFFFLPIWATGVLAFFFYWMPSAFASEFFGTVLALGFVTFSFIGRFPLWEVAVASSLAFFLILGVKNVFLPKRAMIFSIVSAALFIALSFGIFSRFISLPLFAIAVFLVAREGFKAFTTLSQRAGVSAAIVALVLSEIAWVLGWFFISPLSATVIELFFAASLVNLIFRHLRGEITNARAIFWSSTLAVIGMAGMLLAAFK